MPLHLRNDELAHLVDRCLAHVGPWTGTVYRFVTMPYANREDLLSGAGSRHFGGRWNPPSRFNVIYGSLDPETAIAESLGTYSSFGIPAEKARPRAFVAIRLKLQEVLDCTTTPVQRIVGGVLDELREENWQALQDVGEESGCQAFGRLCWERKLEAILVPSVRKPEGVNMVVFPGRRRRGSSWKIQGARDLPRKD